MEFSVYLNFNGNCEDAMTFYKEALGAEMKMMQRYGESPMPCSDADKNKILHCGIEKDGFILMASDGNETHPVTFGNNATISVSFNNEPEIDQTFAAISEGGKVTMPLQDTFWGAKFGMCEDQFGVSWMFNYDRPKS